MTVHLSWLRRSTTDRPVSARLICFPHAGAGASSFNGWVQRLPDWLELVRVQFPGREDRPHETRVCRADDMVVGLIDEVESLLDRPVAFYGHCLGALIAFETARELRRRGLPLPIQLYVSGRRPPQVPPDKWLFDLPEDELMFELEAMGASSPLLGQARWRQYYIANIRSDLEVADRYLHRPEPPLPCPLTLFLGEQDPHTKIDGWKAQTSGAFEEHVVDGGHFFSPRGIGDVIERITSDIGHTLTGAAASTAALQVHS